MAEIFQYLVVLSLAVWTGRLALTKGRNAWIWGGAALILGLLPWHLIGVIPVLALMFIKAPVDSPATGVDPLVCARCNRPHSEGQHFCTGCGWDLSLSFSSGEPDESPSSFDRPNIPSTDHSAEVEPVPGIAELSTSDLEFVSEGEPATAHDESPVLDSDPATDEPPKEHVPWGTYEVKEAPTAAAMVSRGIERFGEGKFQEAIDQFTKAIALDPNYAEAWEQRSVAYAQLGRAQQAEDDRRHLQGLDPSSSPG